ncbi:hypothetical protein [Persicitalea jodogahamensis]|uniref:Uncharacterized protein n=1 Tax=Persicitalea jodogahamensis TaxID=402147 RepID=A0A8J3DBX2_9BACT|nr:hypothetical protein [Persicitalea jodogahamensis]GHB81323.1 hypothetical protein GCM10007390_40160 [Persicitalea jodogahamensis]
MKSVKSILLAALVLLFITSCDKQSADPQNPDTNVTKDKVLIANPWRLVNITDASGKAIPQNQLGLETLAIYLFDIQFFDNNVTKALDRTSRQVVNGGTWYLVENEQILDIEVNQFKGKFGIKELSRAKMTLSNEISVKGVNQPANLVFEPVVK